MPLMEPEVMNNPIQMGKWRGPVLLFCAFMPGPRKSREPKEQVRATCSPNVQHHPGAGSAPPPHLRRGFPG
jgi:hypothetical protein